VDNGRGRSLLSVALRKDETLLGVLSIYRQDADSGGSRPAFRDDLAHYSDLMSLAVPR
jgi:hypothetical protein